MGTTQSIEIDLKPRTTRGKGSSRVLRRQGEIPAVIYGPGSETTLASVSSSALTKALAGSRGSNALLSLKLEGKEQFALVKEIAAHPVTRRPLHVDFYRVDLQRPVSLSVPFHVSGRAIGVQKGGQLRVVFRVLPLRATADKIPDAIRVDVSHLDLNQTLSVQDLKLPEGVSVELSPQQSLVIVGAEEKKRGAGEEEGEEKKEAPAKKK